MTPAADLLTRLLSVGVRVTLDGAEVRCRAAKGVLTPELVRELRAHKPAVLALLTETEEAIAWRIEAFGDALLTEDAAAGESGVCAWCGSPMPPQPGRKCTRCCLASAALLDRLRTEEATYPGTDARDDGARPNPRPVSHDNVTTYGDDPAARDIIDRETASPAGRPVIGVIHSSYEKEWEGGLNHSIHKGDRCSVGIRFDIVKSDRAATPTGNAADRETQRPHGGDHRSDCFKGVNHSLEDEGRDRSDDFRVDNVNTEIPERPSGNTADRETASLSGVNQWKGLDNIQPHNSAPTGNAACGVDNVNPTDVDVINVKQLTAFDNVQGGLAGGGDIITSSMIDPDGDMSRRSERSVA